MMYFSGTFTYDNIIDMSSSGSRQMISKLQTIIQPDSGCNIQFTSGTTGNYKKHNNLGLRNNVKQSDILLF